ncbi:MAG: D-alanyl-D-alanine carboxypeptidase family protein [Parachlamydiaceae bacterium]
MQVAAESAILMNADTGVILYQKKPREKLYPASITKVATCLYVLQRVGDKLDVVLAADQECIGSVTEEAKIRSGYKLPSHWLVTDCSHIGIKKGEKLKVEDLLYGMMVASGDDASNMLAQYVGGTIPNFMTELNAYLKSLGCQDSNFNNPHGLHHPEQVTTALDMAIMTREALKNDLFKKIVSTVKYVKPKTNIQEATPLIQTNRLLRKGDSYYAKAIGVKTGWHSKAGSTLVAAAKDGDRTLIAVLLNVKDRKLLFTEATRMFEAAFKQPKMQKVIVQAGPQKFAAMAPKSQTQIRTYVEKDFNIAFYPAEEPKLKAFIDWKEIHPPVKRGDAVGNLLLKTENGALYAQVALLADEDYDEGIISYIRDSFGKNSLVFSLGILLAALAGFYVLYRFIR